MGKGELVWSSHPSHFRRAIFPPSSDLYFQEEMPGDTSLPSGMRKVAKKPRKQHYTFFPKQSGSSFWESTEVENSTGGGILRNTNRKSCIEGGERDFFLPARNSWGVKCTLPQFPPLPPPTNFFPGTVHIGNMHAVNIFAAGFSDAFLPLLHGKVR